MIELIRYVKTSKINCSYPKWLIEISPIKYDIR